ncbi:YfbU family protein [Leuconostoc suionicum]|uniref:YfbU family protein n=1 Tax=Leuconostoc suionicum TaxID=1511761 RepID=UPI00233F1D71|nr:YfbU family protein [Leuconostoc suionicum]MDC2815432.1 YfbU family protein [Leuconostoc suionicum]
MNSEFTEKERLILANQYQILAELAELRDNKVEAESYRKANKVFYYGYSEKYQDADILGYFEDDNSKISKQGQVEVWNLLKMYDFLIDHYEEAKKQYPDLKEIQFIGYDANDDKENVKMNYMRFIFEEENLFKNVKEKFSTGNNSINSHGSTIIHESMLKTYLNMSRDNTLYDNPALNVKNILESK